MNNEQFRRILLANSNKASGQGDNASPPPAHGGRTAAALGSRQKSSIPMTPRSVAGRVDFSRQLAERDQEGRPQKKFRTSAPRGSKLAEGYVDRAKTREAQEEDDRAERLKSLEQALKDEEIDRETYERLRTQIVGGDLASTHLVKGLDFELLKRIRRGEDVYNESAREPSEQKEEPEPEPEADPDALLDELGAHDVKPVEREQVRKKGQLARAGPGQKRTRDQILADMKAAREAAKAKQQSALGSRFKKIGARQTPGSRIERDSKGREILVTVDEDGNERRKVRKIDPSTTNGNEEEAFKPDKKAEVLGMEVPGFYKKQQLAKQKEEEEKEISIFDDAGSDYDPLAGMDDSDKDDESSEEEGRVEEDNKDERDNKDGGGPKDIETPKLSETKPQTSSAPRNYFKDSKTGLVSAEPTVGPAMSDPTILAALKKAKALDMKAKSEEEIKAAEREARLKKMLQNSNRDDEDLDIGFGTNRFEDEAEQEDKKVKLSTWGGDEHEVGGGGAKSKRKRGPKKRKGDKDSFADVMSVMDRKKASGS